MKTYRFFLIISIVIFLTFVFLEIYVKNSSYVQKNQKIEKDRNDIYIPVDNKKEGKLYDDELRAIEIYEKISPSVVNITYYKTEYINYFFDIYPQQTEGQGSGAIIDKEGHIITNYHVVGEADKLIVALSKEENIYEATIIGVDPENDLAVIKIKNPPKDLIPIPLGSSNDLKIGQIVYAIGNPFGLDRTLTSGIISALERPIKSKNGNLIEGAIQTDASINPGNSGGPLIDSFGNMIGINTMIISPSGGSIGLGFAIPVNIAKEIIPDLIKYGYVKRGWIDASFLPLNQKIARILGYSVDYGLMIISIARNGEAHKAGLRSGTQRAIYGNNIIYIGGDIIVGINNIKIKEYSDLAKVLKNKKPGEIVKIEYIRNNKVQSTELKLIDKREFTSRY